MKTYAWLTGTVVVMVAAGVAPTERVFGPAVQASAGAMGLEAAVISAAPAGNIAAEVQPKVALDVLATFMPEAPTTVAPALTTVAPYAPGAVETRPELSPKAAATAAPVTQPVDQPAAPAAEPGTSVPSSAEQPQATPTTGDKSGSGRAAAAGDLSVLNGIALGDSADSLSERLGKPQRIERDKLLPEYEEYVYGRLRVGVEGGAVQRVLVIGAGPVRIGKTDTPWSREAMEKRLGKPDYVAEDGLVFVQGDHVLKLFLDSQGAPEEIHVYPMSAV